MQPNAVATKTIHSSFGKTLKYVCTGTDKGNKYELIITNKLDKVVYTVELNEEDVLDLAKFIQKISEF